MKRILGMIFSAVMVFMGSVAAIALPVLFWDLSDTASAHDWIVVVGCEVVLVLGIVMAICFYNIYRLSNEKTP